MSLSDVPSRAEGTCTPNERGGPDSCPRRQGKEVHRIPQVRALPIALEALRFLWRFAGDGGAGVMADFGQTDFGQFECFSVLAKFSVVVVVVRTTLQMCLCQQHRSSNWQTPGAESPGSKLPATPAPPAPVSDTGAPKNPNPDHTSQPRPVSVQSGCPPNRR